MHYSVVAQRGKSRQGAQKSLEENRVKSLKRRFIMFSIKAHFYVYSFLLSHKKLKFISLIDLVVIILCKLNIRCNSIHIKLHPFVT